MTQGTVTLRELEGPPPGAGLTTVMESGPGEERRFAETSAVTRRLLTKVVCKAEAFHLMVEPETKFEPTTLRVKPGPPCLLLLGDTAAMDGTGLVIPPPPAPPPPPQLDVATAEVIPSITKQVQRIRLATFTKYPSV